MMFHKADIFNQLSGLEFSEHLWKKKKSIESPTQKFSDSTWKRPFLLQNLICSQAKV